MFSILDIQDSCFYDGRYTTLPQALQTRGYRTAAFSANRFWFTREQGLGQGFTRFEDNFHSLGDMAVRTVYGRKFEELLLKRFFGASRPATLIAPCWTGSSGTQTSLSLLS
jgi:arylsulfatase A-like enzyme